MQIALITHYTVTNATQPTAAQVTAVAFNFQLSAFFLDRRATQYPQATPGSQTLDNPVPYCACADIVLIGGGAKYGSQLVQFVPLVSRLDAGFWHELSREKYHLSEAAQYITGYYTKNRLHTREISRNVVGGFF